MVCILLTPGCLLVCSSPDLLAMYWRPNLETEPPPLPHTLLTVLRLLFGVAYVKYWRPNWKRITRPHTRLRPSHPPQAVTQYLQQVAAQYENGLPTFNVQKSAFVMPRRLNERVELEVRRAI